ncbi:hypothetical protein SALBM311S_05915 [Streptomyces alboniger]
MATSTTSATSARYGTAEMPSEPKSTKPSGRPAAVIGREPTEMESTPRMM